jgi:predicted RNA-binding protein with TRAM domain
MKTNMNVVRKRHERAPQIGEIRKPNSGSAKRGYKPTLSVGNKFNVHIEEMGHRDDGIVRIDGFIVFIPNTFLGEEVTIKITKVMKTTARAIRLA